ncbi:MAG: iron ABC transporter permease [Candidatus Methanomethylophilaceae archaeon]|nr:iron ABC transporter permease [Candidatus Methanomethylophilaceae archaeon]
MGMQDYYRVMNRNRLFIAAVAVLAVAIGAYSISISHYYIGFWESIEIVIEHIQGIEPVGYKETLEDFIVWEGMVPMAFAGVLVGLILGVSGAVMQMVIRNPVADPYTTGISSGALFGVTLFVVFDFGIVGLGSQMGQIVNAFVFSLIPLSIIILFSVFRKVTPALMALIGIAVMYIFSAMTTLLKYTANPDDVAAIYSWSVGTLGYVGPECILPLSLVAVFLVVFMMVMHRRLNVLSTGENTCQSLGESPVRTRVICLVVVSVATSIAVCFTGTLGFIGLVAPHVCRRFVGSNARHLIPASAAMGALMLIAAECLARSVGSFGVSVGVITALIGGPVFLLILMRQRKSAW